MHAARHHERLSRLINQKLESREAAALAARSPFFGFGNGGGSGWPGSNHGPGNNHFDNGAGGNGQNGPAPGKPGIATPTPPAAVRPPAVTPAPQVPAFQPVPAGNPAPQVPPVQPVPAVTPTAANPAGNSGVSGGGNGGGANTQSSKASAPSSTFRGATGSHSTAAHAPSPAADREASAPSSSSTLGSLAFDGSPGPGTSTGSTSGSDATGEPISVSAASKTGVAGSTITAIVVVSLLVLFLLLVLLVRRRWVSRRRDRMERWWFTQKRTSQNYDDTVAQFEEKTLPLPPPASPFVDQRSATPLDLAGISPAHPPAAEVRVHHGVDAPFGHPAQLDYSRFSIGSATSDGSGLSQFIVVHHPESNRAESFKFPKPPFQAEAEATSVHSRQGSGTSGSSYAAVCSLPTKPSTSSSSLARPPLTLPVAAVTRGDSREVPIPNPFANRFDQSIYIPNPFDESPFDDQHALAGVQNFSEIETVQRAYVPCLEDELQVDVCDRVQILEMFEDGWALVEKVGVEGAQEGLAQWQQGLIPIACLRDATFLNTKRVQSFCVSRQTSSIEHGEHPA